MSHKKTNLRKEAKGRECTVRIPFVCNFNPETTILAHLNIGGMGQKAHDLFAALCCSNCHDVIDGRVPWDDRGYNPGEKEKMHLDGGIRTQKIWIDEGKAGIFD